MRSFSLCEDLSKRYHTSMEGGNAFVLKGTPCLNKKADEEVLNRRPKLKLKSVSASPLNQRYVSQSNSWIDNDKQLKEKLYRFISTTDEDCFRSAFQLFTKNNTILLEDFEQGVKQLDLEFSPEQLKVLFSKWDANWSGDVDFEKFMQWNFPNEINATPHLEEKKERISLKDETSFDELDHAREGIMRNNFDKMSFDDLEQNLREKIEQRIARTTDRFRQAFALFTSSRGINLQVFNAALNKLGISLGETKAKEFFDRFDTDESGDINIQEFVYRIFKQELVEKEWVGENELEQKRLSIELREQGKTAFQVHEDSMLSISEIEKLLRGKIEQRIPRSSDTSRQIFKMFTKSNSITPTDFKNTFINFGIKLSDKKSQELFNKYDVNRNGEIDVQELVQGLMPPEDVRQTNLSREEEMVIFRKKQCDLAISYVQDHWSLDEIESILRLKIEQHTTRSSDCFRQAFAIFKKARKITVRDFKEGIAALGIALTDLQATLLFQRYDKNGSGDIDLQEFVLGLLPPDYTRKSWSYDSEERQKRNKSSKKRYSKNHALSLQDETLTTSQIDALLIRKLEDKMIKSTDLYQQALRVFRKRKGITLYDFRKTLLQIGIQVSRQQSVDLFTIYDVGQHGTIDIENIVENQHSMLSPIRKEHDLNGENLRSLRKSNISHSFDPMMSPLPAISPTKQSVLQSTTPNDMPTCTVSTLEKKQPQYQLKSLTNISSPAIHNSSSRNEQTKKQKQNSKLGSRKNKPVVNTKKSIKINNTSKTQNSGNPTTSTTATTTTTTQNSSNPTTSTTTQKLSNPKKDINQAEIQNELRYDLEKNYPELLNMEPIISDDAEILGRPNTTLKTLKLSPPEFGLTPPKARLSHRTRRKIIENVPKRIGTAKHTPRVTFLIP